MFRAGWSHHCRNRQCDVIIIVDGLNMALGGPQQWLYPAAKGCRCLVLAGHKTSPYLHNQIKAKSHRWGLPIGLQVLIVHFCASKIIDARLAPSHVLDKSLNTS